jgi:hypothetical protein
MPSHAPRVEPLLLREALNAFWEELRRLHPHIAFDSKPDDANEAFYAAAERVANDWIAQNPPDLDFTLEQTEAAWYHNAFMSGPVTRPLVERIDQVIAAFNPLSTSPAYDALVIYRQGIRDSDFSQPSRAAAVVARADSIRGRPAPHHPGEDTSTPAL